MSLVSSILVVAVIFLEGLPAFAEPAPFANYRFDEKGGQEKEHEKTQEKVEGATDGAPSGDASTNAKAPVTDAAGA